MPADALAAAMQAGIVKLPVKAWLEVGGKVFDAHDISLTYTAAAVPMANVSLALGYNFDGTKVFDNTNLELFGDGATAEVFVDFTGASPLPGLPIGVTNVFTGYVTAVSPSVSIEGGSTLGVQIQHAGYSDLSSGSTIQWSSMLLNGRPDPALTAGRMTNKTITGGSLVSEGLVPLLVLIYEKFMAESGVNTNARYQLCIGARDLNAAALRALKALSGNKLKLRSELGNDAAMFDFIRERLSSDLWTMGVAEQLQALGQDLFFRCVPRMDGTLDIVPLTTFGTEYAVIDGEHIFAFNPTYAPNRRVAGVITMARPTLPTQTAKVGGCYLFPPALIRSGSVQAVDLPSWMLPTLAQSKILPNNLAAPVTSANATPGVDTAPAAKAAVETAAATYGDKFAREIARKLRYEGCTTEFVTHFRTDIGVLSTVRVNAPLALDQEAAIYGRVDAITLSISSQSGTALAAFSLAYSRSKQTQESILADGAEHPIYTDTWAGGKL